MSQSQEPESQEPQANGAAQGGFRGFVHRFWKLALTLGVVGAIVSYTVPRVLDRGSEAVRGAIGSNAPLLATVRHPGEYQSLSFYAPMYLFASPAPEDVPKSLLAGGALPELWAWARQNGAVPGQEQTFRVTLRGRGDQPVIIDGFRPRVVERAEPLAGWFTHERGCGDVGVREARIDLDSEPPTISFSRGLDEEPGREQLALTIQVTSTDVEVVDVLAVTKRSDVRWELDVLYTAAGDTGILVVRDGDEPFEVTALQGGRARFYRHELPPRLVRERAGDPSSTGLTFC
jgi:hypothetical protein